MLGWLSRADGLGLPAQAEPRRSGSRARAPGRIALKATAPPELAVLRLEDHPEAAAPQLAHQLEAAPPRSPGPGARAQASARSCSGTLASSARSAERTWTGSLGGHWRSLSSPSLPGPLGQLVLEPLEALAQRGRRPPARARPAQRGATSSHARSRSSRSTSRVRSSGVSPSRSRWPAWPRRLPGARTDCEAIDAASRDARVVSRCSRAAAEAVARRRAAACQASR